MALAPFGTFGTSMYDPFSSLFGTYDPFARRGYGGGLLGDVTDVMPRGMGVGDVFAPFGTVAGGTTWPMDLVEYPERYEIRADAPGFAPDEVHVNQDGRTITVSGRHDEKRDWRDESDVAGKVWRSERVSRSFRRSFYLPQNVKLDEIHADLNNGVLTVNIPKAQEAVSATKRIEVKGGESKPQQISQE